MFVSILVFCYLSSNLLNIRPLGIAYQTHILIAYNAERHEKLPAPIRIATPVNIARHCLYFFQLVHRQAVVLCCLRERNISPFSDIPTLRKHIIAKHIRVYNDVSWVDSTDVWLAITELRSCDSPASDKHIPSHCQASNGISISLHFKAKDRVHDHLYIFLVGRLHIHIQFLFCVWHVLRRYITKEVTFGVYILGYLHHYLLR